MNTFSKTINAFVFQKFLQISMYRCYIVFKVVVKVFSVSDTKEKGLNFIWSIIEVN